MPNPKPFDGYMEVPARVSSTALVHLQRNRYSVPSEHAHEVVSLRLYPDLLEVVADNARVAAHVRSFERSQTCYSPRPPKRVTAFDRALGQEKAPGMSAKGLFLFWRFTD